MRLAKTCVLVMASAAIEVKVKAKDERKCKLFGHENMKMGFR